MGMTMMKSKGKKIVTAEQKEKNSKRKNFILKTSCFSHKTRECYKRRIILKTNHLADGDERDGAM